MPSTQRLRLGMWVNYRKANGDWEPAQVFGITGTQANLRQRVITGGTWPLFTYGLSNLNGGALVSRITAETQTNVYRTYRGT